MNHDPPFANSGVYNYFFGGSTTTVRGLGFSYNFGTTKAGASNKMGTSQVLGVASTA